MSHKQQQQFCQSINERFPDMFKGRTLDVGALNINGCNRPLFTGEYIGLDIGEGNNVDVVCIAHEYNAEDESFDCIISTECFEHDMYYEKTIKNIMRMLRKGGLFLFTCATTGRREHGTINSTSGESPLTIQKEGWNTYYKNLTVDDFLDIPEFKFEIYGFSTNEEVNDLYFWGIK